MTSNSTTTPLVIGGTFTGTWEKRLTNCFLDVSIFASTNTLLYIQQSSNASQITNNDLYSYLTPGTAAIHQQPLVLEYFRVVVTNSSAATQTYLREIARLNNVNISNGVALDPQPVSGTVDVGNFPATQAVTGDFYQATQPVSGTVDVGNFPAEQVVDVSGVVITSSQHLNNLNATYAAGAVVGTIISANAETNVPYVTIEVSSPTVFTIGQITIIKCQICFNYFRKLTRIPHRSGSPSPRTSS